MMPIERENPTVVPSVFIVTPLPIAPETLVAVYYDRIIPTKGFEEEEEKKKKCTL